jgi:hypothetical protein
VVLVGPLVRLVGQGDKATQCLGDAGRDVEGSVAFGRGDPDEQVMLGGRYGEAVRSDDQFGEAGRSRGTRARWPQLRPESVARQC